MDGWLLPRFRLCSTTMLYPNRNTACFFSSWLSYVLHGRIPILTNPLHITTYPYLATQHPLSPPSYKDHALVIVYNTI